jgi:hypothetical protein
MRASNPNLSFRLVARFERNLAFVVATALLALVSACEYDLRSGATRFTLQSLAQQLSSREIRSDAEAAQVLRSIPGVSSARVQSELGTAYASALSDPRPHRWKLEERRVRTPILCPTDCLCLAERLSAAALRAEASLLVLRVRIVGGGHGGVTAWVNVQGRPGLQKAGWDYHVVTVIGDSAGAWSVVDPLVFGDARLHTVAEWYDRYEHVTPVEYSIQKN